MILFYLIQNPIYLIAFISALIIGITVHEFAHAWVAHKCGDPTPKLEGRLTLNPLAHLDPLGTLFIFLVGFGWGKAVQINPNYFNKKSDELKVSIAGILANLLVAIIIAIPIRIALINGQLIDSSQLLSVLNVIVELNIILAAFNILPIPPLDGSHFVEYFLSEESKNMYQYAGPFLLIGLIIMENIMHLSILSSFMEPIIRFFSFIVKGVPTSLF